VPLQLTSAIRQKIENWVFVAIRRQDWYSETAWAVRLWWGNDRNGCKSTVFIDKRPQFTKCNWDCLGKKHYAAGKILAISKPQNVRIAQNFIFFCKKGKIIWRYRIVCCTFAQN